MSLGAAQGAARQLDRSLDDQLRERVAGLRRDTRALLGLAAGQPSEDRAGELGRLADELVALLRSSTDAERLDRDREAHEAALARLRRRFDDRAAALALIDEAVVRLRQITSPAAMLSRAPEELCASSDLDRVILSRVDAGTMVAEAVYVRGDPDGARTLLEALREAPVTLDHSLIETEVLRRRRATVVADAPLHPRVHRATAELLGWQSYVAAPVVQRKRAVAVIHADRGPLPVDVLHRDVLWEFASGLAQAHESATLRRTLRGEREQLREFLDWLDARSAELNDSDIDLSLDERPRRSPPEPLAAAAQPSRIDDRRVFAGLITRRELDVLRLLAEGASNRQIGDELVISQGTVKFHVNGILRKLRAANRAEAVSRYVKLVDLRQIRP